MFCNCKKKIEDLNSKLNKLDEYQQDFIKNALNIMTEIENKSKAKYVWELRQEEVEDIAEGRKLKKIRKILE